jgi:ATP-dependent Zn protease
MPTLNNINMCEETYQRVTEEASFLLSEALRLQGPKALLCERGHAARHEAGHAVGHLVEGRRVRSVEVFQRGDSWLGKTMSIGLWSIKPDTNPDEDLSRARILLSGPLAELLTSKQPALGGGIDEIVMAKMIIMNAAEKIGRQPDELLLETFLVVIEWIKQYKPIIDKIAHALMRQKKIKGFEISRLLSEIRPTRCVI